MNQPSNDNHLDCNYESTNHDNLTQKKSEAKRLSNRRHRVKIRTFADGHRAGIITYSPYRMSAGRADKDPEKARDYMEESLARTKSSIEVLSRHNFLSQMVTATIGDRRDRLPSELLSDFATFCNRQGKKLSIGKVLAVAGRGSNGKVHIHAGVSDGRCWGKETQEKWDEYMNRKGFVSVTGSHRIFVSDITDWNTVAGYLCKSIDEFDPCELVGFKRYRTRQIEVPPVYTRTVWATCPYEAYKELGIDVIPREIISPNGNLYCLKWDTRFDDKAY